MFLRRNRRVVDGESYEYWSLVETYRTAKGPRQRVVASLGKSPGLDTAHQRQWADLDLLLEGAPTGPVQMELPSSTLASTESRPFWAEVDLAGLRVERVRDFGHVYLGLSLWRRLGLHTVLRQVLPSGQEDVPWDLTACILTLARFCGQKSELEVAERWFAQSALDDLLGVATTQVNEARLYRGLDAILPHKDALCQHLQKRYESLFGVRFEFLLYDVTSTYFEGQAEGNEKAARGYSRDQRPDCKQVNIGLVVTPEGLPVGYEVFAGNRTDVTTVEDMVRLMEEKYGKAERIWVMDRGMVSEDNIDFLRARGARYLVGTPKRQLRRFEAQLLEQQDWTEVQPGVQVKLIRHPDQEGGEIYVLCKSAARQEKEAAMLELRRQRLKTELEKIDATLKRKPVTDVGPIERRIGRWMGKYAAAERLIEAKLVRNEAGAACGLEIQERAGPSEWARHAHGAYLLRTNCTEMNPVALWRWYMQLTQVEDAFRISKSDLYLRPVFHQKTERVDAHILVCFLSLVLWRTLENWMKCRGLGTCARPLIEEVATVRRVDVVLPLQAQAQESPTEVRLRVVTRPDPRAAELLSRLGLELPTAPRRIGNVVAKNGQKSS
jgi:transposase